MLVFNVNDFDEAYVGPFLWDLKRFAASVALLGYAKALSDEVIGDLVAGFAAGVPDRAARRSRAGGDDAIGSLTLDTTDGVLRRVLQQARLNTRVACWTGRPSIDDYDRRFALMDGRRTSRRGDPGRGLRRPSRTTWRRCRRTLEPGPSTPSRTWCCARAWASARPGCPRTTCCWRGTPRRWRTTSSST